MATDPTSASREQWLARVRAVLKDAPFERLASRTVEDLLIQPLYGPGDGAAARAGPQHRRRPAEDAMAWDVRVPVAHPDPARANDQVLESLAGGASSVLLSVHSGAAAGLGRALDGVMLEAATVALDAGFGGPEAAQGLSDLAKGSPSARLAFHLDPLSAFARSGASPGPIEGHIAAVARAGARLAKPHPAASLVLASGRTAHEAGGSAAQELGLMAASALAYAKALTAAGLPPGQAFAGIVLGLSADGEYLQTLAKLRAARDIWARMTRACRLQLPACIEVRSSRRMLSGFDSWTNLLRLTAAGFGAAAGGADAIVLDAFTDAIGPPGAQARRLARNLQLVLMEESHIGRVEDPAAGAWFIESMTRELARQGWRQFQAIEAQGGVVQALVSGAFATEVRAVHQARETAVAEGALPILGVTLFLDPEARPVEVDDEGRIAPGVGVNGPRLNGPDSRCPPLEPMRLAEAAELVMADLEP